MNLKEMYDSEQMDESSSYSVPSDIGLKKYKSSGRKIRFMRGYTDDGELIIDPFDPKSRNDDGTKPINYNKRFSKEMKQHHKLIRQQALYVDQLEKLFRQTTGLGTANPRQLTKTDVELASVLSQARGQLLQMINGVSSLKKTISDLQLKQLQKLAVGDGSAENGGGGVLPADLRGSMIMKQVYEEDASGLGNIPNAELLSNLPDINSVENGDSSLVSNDVRFENQNITLAVIYDLSTSQATPVALNDSGEIIDDYNIPTYMYDLELMLTESTAKDQMGHTYPIITK